MQAKRSKIGSLRSYASLLFSFPFQELPHSQIILQEKKDDHTAFIFWFNHPVRSLTTTSLSLATVIWQLEFTVQNFFDTFRTLFHSSFGAPYISKWGILYLIAQEKPQKWDENDHWWNLQDAQT